MQPGTASLSWDLLRRPVCRYRWVAAEVRKVFSMERAGIGAGRAARPRGWPRKPRKPADRFLVLARIAATAATTGDCHMNPRPWLDTYRRLGIAADIAHPPHSSVVALLEDAM